MAKRLQDDEKEAAKPNLSPDTFLEHYRYIRRAKVALDEASSDYRGTRKRAKAVGIDLVALAMMERLAAMDADAAMLRMKQLGYYGTLASLPCFTQTDLFGTHGVPAPTEKSLAEQAAFDAEEDGRFAGAGGEPRDNNIHVAGTDLHTHWDTGWREGKTLFDRRAEEAGTVVSKPRGRPRKSGNPEDRPTA